jgi:hypothetical protein
LEKIFFLLASWRSSRTKIAGSWSGYGSIGQRRIRIRTKTSWTHNTSYDPQIITVSWDCLSIYRTLQYSFHEYSKVSRLKSTGRYLLKDSNVDYQHLANNEGTSSVPRDFQKAFLQLTPPTSWMQEFRHSAPGSLTFPGSMLN